MAELTGRTRYRTKNRFLRKPLLVLQVEEKGDHWIMIGDDTDHQPYVDWRDATVEDLNELPF